LLDFVPSFGIVKLCARYANGGRFYAIVLNQRQQRFVESYVRVGNATQAAREAGYEPGFAASTGWKLLQNQQVLAAIDERRRDLDALRDELFQTRCVLDATAALLAALTERVSAVAQPRRRT
jgi:phage terminase small subunit